MRRSPSGIGTRRRRLAARALLGAVLVPLCLVQGLSPAGAAIRPSAEMPTPVPLTQGASQAVHGATVSGWVQINDDVSGDPVVSCTGSLATQRGGITRFDVIPGTDASAAPTNTALAQNKIVRAEAVGFSSGVDTVSAANAYWSTFGRDRGTYTIKPTYYTRLPSLACSKGTTTATGPSGPAGASCPDARLVSYITALTVIGAVSTAQCAGLNVLGTATAGAPIQVHVDNRSELLLSPATDQNSQVGDDPVTFVATATLRAAATNLNTTTKPVIAGKPVIFEIDGVAVGAPVVTNASGVATAPISNDGLAAGVHHLTARFVEDAAWRGSVSAPTVIKLADDTVAPQLTLPTSTTWNETFEVTASVVGTGGDVPQSGLMQFTFGTQKATAEVEDGAATHRFTATQSPGTYAVTATYLGDEVFNASPTTTRSITVQARQTTVVYDGPAGARWGDDIELGATLTDTLSGLPMAGRPVTFTIGSQTLTATTGSDGRATSSVPATADVGTYSATATYPTGHDVHYLGSSAEKAIAIGFRHRFAGEGATIGLNPATQQFEYEGAGSEPTGIIATPGMFSVFLPSDVNYQGLPALPSVPVEQTADNATYVPGGTPIPLPDLSALPGLPAFPAAGSPDEPAADDTARDPVPVGGATLGDYLTRLAGGDYPSDLTACQVLTRSECERRLTVLVHQQPGFVLIGVFDLQTGAFSAFKLDAAGALPLSAFDALAVEVPSVPILTPPSIPTPDLPLPTVPDLPEGAEVPGAPEAPAAPAPPAPGTLAAFLVDQVNAVAATAGMTPAQVAQQVLTLDIPTPEGGVQQVTTTIQGAIDRFGGTVLFDPSNTGISETPEINAGSMMHTATFTRTYGGKSVAKGSPRPYATKAEGEALLPKYQVTTSDYVPATPLVPGINPLVLVPTGTLPVQAPEGVVPPGAENPLLAIHWGGKLINVQGSGWDQTGADPARGITAQSGTGAHTGGDSALGTSLDTAPRQTEGLDDPWPVHVPMYTSNSAIPDRSIDFLGFGMPIVVATCIDLGSFDILSTTTYLGMVCLSVNVLLADGVASFNGGSPVDFRTDLDPLWQKPAPAVEVASAAIAGLVAQLPSSTSLLGTALGAVPALPSTSDPVDGLPATGEGTSDPVTTVTAPVATVVQPVTTATAPVTTVIEPVTTVTQPVTTVVQPVATTTTTLTKTTSKLFGR